MNTPYILISIKPEYARKILDGSKKYEFRKIIPTNAPRDATFFIYESAPVMRITGMFTIEGILEGTPDFIWQHIPDKEAGISDCEFYHYFHRRRHGYALKIHDTTRFLHPVDPRAFRPYFRAPQSFAYIDIEFFLGIHNKSRNGDQA